MDRAQVMNHSSQHILPLSYSWKATSHFRLMIQAHEFVQGDFGSCGLEGQEVCSVKFQQFKVDKRNMLLSVSSPIP